MTRMPITISVLLAAMTVGSAANAQNVENGEAIFKKCRACHRVGPDAQNAVGPVLNGVIGRQAGTAAGYQYSELNKAAGGNGLVWTEERILAYLADPSPFLKKFLEEKGQGEIAKGATKMVFKLADEQERKDVVAYLKTFSPPKK